MDVETSHVHSRGYTFGPRGNYGGKPRGTPRLGKSHGGESRELLRGYHGVPGGNDMFLWESNRGGTRGVSPGIPREPPGPVGSARGPTGSPAGCRGCSGGISRHPVIHPASQRDAARAAQDRTHGKAGKADPGWISCSETMGAF